MAGRTGTGRETKPGGGSEEGGRAKERSLKERRGKVEGKKRKGESRGITGPVARGKKMSGRVAKGEKSEKK